MSGAPGKPSLGQRLKEHILHPELSPEQVAWSFALGLAIAWNPLIGTHTGMIVILCFAFKKLHRPLMLLAAFVNNPWTLVPMATASAYLGNLLMGRGLALDLSGVRWKEIGWRSFTSWEGLMAVHRMVEPVLAPYLLGGFALTAASLVLGWFAMRWLTVHLRRVHWKELHLPHFHHQGVPAPERKPDEPEG